MKPWLAETVRFRILTFYGDNGAKTAASLAELIRRPELYEKIVLIDSGQTFVACVMSNRLIYFQIKYEGYIRDRQNRYISLKKVEKRMIPADSNYDDGRIRKEARQKVKGYQAGKYVSIQNLRCITGSYSCAAGLSKDEAA